MIGRAFLAEFARAVTLVVFVCYIQTARAQYVDSQCTTSPCGSSAVAFCATGVSNGTCPRVTTATTSLQHRFLVVLDNGMVYMPCSVSGTVATGSSEAYNTTSRQIFTPPGAAATPRFNFWTAPIASSGFMIFGGGDNSGTKLASVETYNVASGAYTTNAYTIPTPRTVGTFGRNTYLTLSVFAGGVTSSSLVTNAVEVFDSGQTPSSAWTRPTLTTARTAAGIAVTSNGQFWVAGGTTDSVALASIEVYDGSSLTFIGGVPSLSLARQLPAACNSGTDLWFGGGGDFAGSVFYDTLDTYNSLTLTLTRTLKMPRQRYLGFCAASNNLVVFASGYTTGSILTPVVDVFDVGTNVWTTGQPLAAGKFGNTAVQYPVQGGSLLVLGPSSFATPTLNVDAINMTCYACTPNPCLNGATFNGVNCSCAPGFAGINCQTLSICNLTYVGGTSGVQYVVGYLYTANIATERISTTNSVSTVSACYSNCVLNGPTHFFTFLSTTTTCSCWRTLLDGVGVPTVNANAVAGPMDSVSVINNIPSGTQRGVLCSNPQATAPGPINATNQICNGSIWSGAAPMCALCSPACQQGTCTYPSGTCTCFPGWSGAQCQTNINECASIPCLNGATCVDVTNSFLCTCAPGYSGTLCQTDINECASAPCVSGGTCIDHAGFYSCQCLSGYSGMSIFYPFILSLFFLFFFVFSSRRSKTWCNQRKESKSVQVRGLLVLFEW